MMFNSLNKCITPPEQKPLKNISTFSATILESTNLDKDTSGW